MGWRKTTACLLLCLLVVAERIPAQALPAWTDADRARLKKGDLIAGVGILVDESPETPTRVPGIAPGSVVPPVLPNIPEPDYNPKVIPKEYLVDYFSSVPEKYLIDPQRLMTMQESLDREGFLEYHADDSTVDIRMYMFDAQQQIPAPHTIQQLISEHYAKEPLTAVVFCFFGDPSRNLLAFGGQGASELAAARVYKMLESARMKAMEKSDPADQVESFIVQLSIRLFWLEKEVESAQAMASVPKPATEPGQQAAGRQTADRTTALAALRPYLLYIAGAVCAFLALVLGGWVSWRVWRRSRVYTFPALDVPRRLGADYAAGIGAVVSFHNKLGAPSSQRNQMPDYLTRM